MVVFNSVSHDARVLKEADSLARFGHRVTIFGLVDKSRDDRPENTLENGVRVVRIAPEAIDTRRMISLGVFGLLGVLGVIGALAASYLFYEFSDVIRGSFDLSSLRQWLRQTIIFLFVDHLLMTSMISCGLNLLLVFVLLGQPPKSLANLVKSVKKRCRSACKSINRSIRRAIKTTKSVIHKRLTAFARRTFLTRMIRRRRFHSWEKRVIEQLEQCDPHVVHCHDVHTLAIGVRLKRKSGVHLVYDSHELPEHQNGIGLLTQLKTIWLQKRFCSVVDVFVTVNQSIADYFARGYRGLPRPTVIMNATREKTSRVVYDGRLHKAAGLKSDDKILLFQGGFARGRGLPSLIKAAPLLPEGWYLVLMGSGYFESELRELLKKLPGAKNRIRFIPPAPQQELMHWTAGAAVGAIPYENTCLNHKFCSPNKLWEYPNADVPILATKFPEMERIISSASIGWLIDDPVTPTVIADVIRQITTEELTVRKENCRRFVARHNWTLYEKRLLNAYGRLQAPLPTVPEKTARLQGLLSGCKRVPARIFSKCLQLKWQLQGYRNMRCSRQALKRKCRAFSQQTQNLESEVDRLTAELSAARKDHNTQEQPIQSSHAA